MRITFSFTWIGCVSMNNPSAPVAAAFNEMASIRDGSPQLFQKFDWVFERHEYNP